MTAERSSGAAAIASGTHTRVADSGNSASGEGSLVAFWGISAASAGHFAEALSLHRAGESLQPSSGCNIQDNLDGDFRGDLYGESLCRTDHKPSARRMSRAVISPESARSRHDIAATLVSMTVPGSVLVLAVASKSRRSGSGQRVPTKKPLASNPGSD